jgi:hypothetical protein
MVLILTSYLLSYTISNPDNYSKIKFKITLNCCTCFEFDVLQDTGAWVLETDSYLIDVPTGTITIKEFAVSTFTDGIYKIDMTIFDDEGTGVLDENCVFFDCLTKCLVGAEIDKLLATDLKNIDTEIHMIHWGLTTASTCGCNCDEMCELYNRLIALLQSNPECDYC